MRLLFWAILTGVAVWAVSAWVGPALQWSSGKLHDGRDGKEYKVTVIGGKTWMAENLDYQTPHGSWCYRNNDSNCVKYGRLYNWKAAKSACPSGWHLPTVQEWDSLGKAAGGQRDTYGGHINWRGTGKKLKAKRGWKSDNSGKRGDGADSRGFSALPGGNRRPDDYFFTVGTDGNWWTATVSKNKGSAHIMSMSLDSDDLEEATAGKEYGFSVRCVLGESGAAEDQSEAEEENSEQNEAEQAEQQIEIDSSYLIDERDGKKYRAVRIGGKRWMAENLRYKVNNSLCYNGSLDSCVKYGRLYDWDAAAVSCPAGWRLPFLEDWDSLAQAAGGKARPPGWKGTVDWDGAGRKLKAKSSWDDYAGNSGNGTDDYGFRALAGGYYVGAFRAAGADGEWWSATTADDSNTFYAGLYCHSNTLSQHYSAKQGGRSVRCVESSPEDLARMKTEEELRQKRAEQLKMDEAQKQKDEERRKRNEEEQRKKEEERLKKEAAQKIEKATSYFTDSRDGKKYRAVEIGGKRWMAENLNYTTPSGSWCYDNKTSNCNKYGRLYNWNTAKTVCPAGWHLPARQEWGGLAKMSVVEKKSDGGSVYWRGSGKALKAKNDWNDFEGGIIYGTDDYGFSALPGGFRNHRNGGFINAGNYGCWWTATEGNSGFACHINMGYASDRVEERNRDVEYGYSVRCIADN